MSDEFKDLRIMIVDDFEMIRITIKSALHKLNVKNIDEAKDGADGLEKLKKKVESGGSYDLIFCDWNMPNMTGIQLLEACKKDPKIAPIPFIMVTSETEKGFVLDAIKLGAADYVVKPFAIDTIEKKLNKVFKK